MRHANAAGSAAMGGGLAVVGDDHACKSSSYPTQSEYAMMHLEIPVLNPSCVQDVLDYGLYGWALSRYAGTWVSLIALADIMDSSAVVQVGPERAAVRLPEDFTIPSAGVHIRNHDRPLEQEARLRNAKLPAVLAFARANQLNRVVNLRCTCTAIGLAERWTLAGPSFILPSLTPDYQRDAAFGCDS